MTSAELKILIDSNYPNNNTGLITPALERQVLKSIVDHINSSQGEADTTPFVYDPAFSYAAGVPVIYNSAWFLSLVAANLNNQPDISPLKWDPINAFNTVLSIWEVNAVYLGELSIVIKDNKLYLLDRDKVGSSPYVSTDFVTELSVGDWVNLLPNSTPVRLPGYADNAAMIAAQSGQASGYFYLAGAALYIYLGTTTGDITDYFAVGSGGGGTTLSPHTIAALQGTEGTPSDTNRYVTATGLNTALNSLELPITKRRDEVDYIILSDISGTLITGKWYNDANELKTVTNQPITFIGKPTVGNLRWDVMEGRADGTAVLVSGVNGASAVRPTVTATAVPLFELIWNEEGEAVQPPNDSPSVWSLERFSTAVVADTTGKYCKIMEMDLGFAQDYSFILDYGAPASLAANKVGSLHVAFVCTEARIIHSPTVKLTTVGFSEAGDFVLVQLPGNKASLYHKSTNYWMRLQWRVTFHNAAMALSNFKQGEVYGTLPLGDNWQSVVNSGDTIPDDFTTQAGSTLAFDDVNKYGFNGTPLTGNLTFSITGAKETVMIKALHNSATAPTVTAPVGVTLIKEGGDYTVSVDNTLYAIVHKLDNGTVNKISYSWTQSQP